MEKQLHTKPAKELFDAILSLQSVSECRLFMRDLCALSELEAMTERFQIVKRLNTHLSYREISKETGSSTATITRVAHWLHNGGGGYKIVLERTT